jgi:hypothetical protein
MSALDNFKHALAADVDRFRAMEAGAALFVMTEGAPGWADRVVEALGGTARRSEDLIRELQDEALVVLLEEHCEEELAAGRMRKITDAAGKTRYQVIPPGEQRT